MHDAISLLLFLAIFECYLHLLSLFQLLIGTGYLSLRVRKTIAEVQIWICQL